MGTAHFVASDAPVLATHQTRGRPRSRFYQIARRVADRLSPAVARSYLGAVAKLQRQIDEAALRQAVASGHPDQITAAVATGGDLGTILDGTDLDRQLLRTSTATGRAGADVITGVTGVNFQFNAMHPDVVLFARREAGDLIAAIHDDIREAVRVVLAMGQYQGLTVVQQARAIREIVGLPPAWANAPLNLREELLDGRFTRTRRLSATDKAQVRSRLARGTMTEAFAGQMQEKYRKSLLNARALRISRTESLRASHHGQQQCWKQAIGEGVLPDTVRRVWIVTPDDRLEHWMVPGMNVGGRGMDEMFDTPEGPVLYPPSRPHCRCGAGLRFPGRPGVL